MHIIYSYINMQRARPGTLEPAKSSPSSALKVAGFSKLSPTLLLGLREKRKALTLRAFAGRAPLSTGRIDSPTY